VYSILEVGKRLSKIVCWLHIPDLTQLYLIGFYEEKEFSLYISALSNEIQVPVRWANTGLVFFDWKVNAFYLCSVSVIHLPLVGFNLVSEDDHRYLREDKPHGSAGGLYKFQDLLMDDDPVSPYH